MSEVRAAKGERRSVELGKRQQSEARRAAESKATVPHLYLAAQATLPDEATELADAELIAACAAALREFPRLNSAYRDGVVEEHSRINVGVVTETAAGTVTATIFDAESKDASELGAELGALRSGAHEGSLTSPDLAGGTFTLTRLEQGSGPLLATVTPGQSAHLSAGVATPGAIVRDGALLAGHQIALGLAFDARAIRPPVAAGFLDRLAELIGSRLGAEA